ncbi:MAG: PDZ domain-containing protein [Gammaproteobacteria bacterium]|nr:PDZ domain-containing protein [Gammaproteobacteria bacterium]
MLALRIILFVSILAFAQAALADDTRLLRFPDIHEDRVVFVYAGDLYTASSNGGNAVRLTSHEGLEQFPKFSPDGSQIAYSAEYNGTRQVYVIPSAGGAPRQLTWYNDVGAMPPRGGSDYRVLDWSRDGQHVLVRANRLPWGVRMGRYHLVPANGGDESPMEIPEGGGGMFSPDGTKVVYTPIDREFRTWKRYRGGRAQDVWIYDLENSTSKQLTDNPATDHQPVWVGEDIYFTSDRDYTLNLYRYSADGSEAVTAHTEFDVLWASAGPKAVVYENGGWIYRYDPASGESRKLAITVGGDRPATLPRVVEAAEFIEAADLSPNAKRVLITARGDVFSVPATQGPVRNLTRTPETREIDASWSPDGKQLAYLSDASGEYEIWVRPVGGGDARRVTKDGATWRFAPAWSPDSSKLIFGDTNQRLNVVDVKSGRVSVIDSSVHNDITDYSWAPDSRFVTYVKNDDLGTGSVWVYSFGNKRSYQVTSNMTDESEPVFDPQGRYLYFLSSRDQDLQFSSIEFNYMVTNSTRVYAAQLDSSAPALFLPKSDEVMSGNDTNGEEENGESGDEAVAVNIDFDGIEDRVVALQPGGGNYNNLAASPNGPVYVSGQNGETQVMLFDLEKEEEVTVLEGVESFSLSGNGEKILYSASSELGIADLAPEQDASEGRLDLDDMELLVDPKIEWQQMYVDGWRILRDWFYDPNMHGMDWDGIRSKYEPLVQHVAHRADLDYIFGEIAGEMNAGHIYVQSGDQPAVERRNGGLLGAEFKREGDAYRVARIFKGETWQAAFYSPLAAPGVEISVGDYVVAVNGVPTAGAQNFYQLLENTGGDVVTLTVNDKPSARGSRDVMVRTVTSETQLRYLDWVEDRARRVDELSGGRIGYVHLPNTAGDGNRELFKRFMPQMNKDALIIDARYNGGGFIPDRMIELVSRKPLNYWKRRGLEPQATPTFSHTGPKATLINGYSSSGGDAFPYYFKKLGLGALIGTRTWGGLIGISGNPSLADGGSILASTFRFMDTDNEWAVENEGVSPDIEVVDRPELVAAGKDPTLEEAVRHLLRELEKAPKVEVKAPLAPTEF